jgi:hypothetical protein
LTATEDRELRRTLHSTLGSVQPAPVPIEAIIRRGKGVRLRRAGAAAGALGVAGIIAVAAAALLGSQQPTVPPAAPAITAGPDGVFASGTANGHPWRLAVQNIADPGYPCLPGITINGTDADWVYPDPGDKGVVGLGPALPGFGFGFIQLPADINEVIVNGRHNVPAVTVVACGDRYHIVGFAYSLAEPLQVTVTNPPPGWSRVITMPVVSIQPPSPATTPESPGLWINTGSANREAAAAGTLASGTLPGGQGWTIKLRLETGDECYELDGTSSLGSAQMGYCGPVSTPDGPETIMALPLGFPDPGVGATGYAFQVSPGTARIKVTLSNGVTELATMRVVDGRKYAAFIVPSQLRLAKLTWIDTRGRVIATATALPQYGYVQFQP